MTDASSSDSSSSSSSVHAELEPSSGLFAEYAPEHSAEDVAVTVEPTANTKAVPTANTEAVTKKLKQIRIKDKYNKNKKEYKENKIIISKINKQESNKNTNKNKKQRLMQSHARMMLWKWALHYPLQEMPS